MPADDATPGERALPTTTRGLHTRAALIAAARRVFERDGFLSSRLVDITQEAGLATGSFYTYFATKEEVLHAVFLEAQQDMLHPGFPRLDETDDPAAVIAASNLAYLEAYRRNARLMALLEQATSINEEFRQLRLQRSDAFVKRNARSIAALQERGLVDERLDALVAARCLSAMTSRLAYHYFVDQSGDDAVSTFTHDQMVTTVNSLWVNALRLPAAVG